MFSNPAAPPLAPIINIFYFKFDTRTRLFFFTCLKDAPGAGAALKSGPPAPSCDQPKKRLRLQSSPKSAGSSVSGSATLTNTVISYLDGIVSNRFFGQPVPVLELLAHFPQ